MFGVKNRKLKTIFFLISVGITIIVVLFITRKTALKSSLDVQGSFLTKTNLVPAQFTDKNFFLSAIKQSKSLPLEQKITGITVPHHLLARDVMADIFIAASENNYDRVIVFSPDHFHLGKSKISYAVDNFDTVFGILPTDQEFVYKLASVQNAGKADFFYREHGIGAELPFIKYFFPQAKVVVLAFAVNTEPEDLKSLIDFLKNNIDQKTLLVQSTDFSHYLTAAEASIKDEQTISVLQKIDQGENPQSLYQLNEPDNLDCIGCQYVQSSLQQVLKTHVHIVDRKNSQSYSAAPVAQTTSYIPQIYY